MRKYAVIALVGLLSLPGLAGPRDSARALLNALQTRRISIDFDKASLDDFVKYIRAASGINIVVMQKQIEKDGGEIEGIEITLKVNDVKLIDALRLVNCAFSLPSCVSGSHINNESSLLTGVRLYL